VPFQREVSIIAARGRDGETVFYPLSENVHRNGILFTSRALLDDELQKSAEVIVKRLLDTLDYVGVLCLELFDVNGELVANEFAPRVHNSGHWTIEGSDTSQFENHMRAVAGLPLGNTACVGFPAMVNIVGTHPDLSTLLQLSTVHVHFYGKTEKPLRKLGHITVRASSVRQREEQIAAVLRIIEEKIL
jgi:5-(carboxyamino)imidazole ribonucleotide synthase